MAHLIDDVLIYSRELSTPITRREGKKADKYFDPFPNKTKPFLIVRQNNQDHTLYIILEYPPFNVN